MNEGDVVLVPLPQADGQLKVRPSLALRLLPPFNDLLVCGISTQLHQEAKGFDDIIAIDDADFTKSGLRATSLIRLGFLGVAPADAQRHHKLLKRLAAHLTQNVA